MSDLPPPDLDEEALVRRLQEQNAQLAKLAQVHEPVLVVAEPVRVTVFGETYTVPLTARDIRAALPAPAAAEFEEELACAPPHTVGPLLRKWALETIPGDPVDRVDVLIAAERQVAGGTGTAAA